ncbi:MAG: glycosyltransferase [Deltaproteobacteria bacterium]|nr:glycosyltransferase [Deltaproteobacteria bacterium]
MTHLVQPLESGHAILVVPCYNEASRLDLGAIARGIADNPRVAFIFVDDGSTDATAAVLEELCNDPLGRLRWKKLARNCGKAEAVRQGVLAALELRPAMVGYWDADFSTPLDVVGDYLALLDRDPRLLAVFGSRVRRLGAEVERKPLRHYAGRIFATVASMVLGIGVYDTQCGAKLFRVTDAVANAFAEPFSSRWIFDVELLARLRREVAPQPLAPLLLEYPLPRWRDVAGSKLTLWHGIAAFGDLWRIARKYR